MKQFIARIKHKRLVLIACLSLLGLGAVGIGTSKHMATVAQRKETQAAEEAKATAQQLALSEQLKKEAAQKINTDASNAKQPAATPANAKATPTRATSTRSTTANKPGDVLESAPAKNEKRYFAGRFNFSPSTVTVSKSSPRPISVTISTPDGQAVPMPHKSWDDYDPYVFAYASASSELRSSWTMMLDASSMPLGTFEAYAVSNRATSTDTWEYSGHLTVHVVE